MSTFLRFLPFVTHHNPLVETFSKIPVLLAVYFGLPSRTTFWLDINQSNLLLVCWLKIVLYATASSPQIQSNPLGHPALLTLNTAHDIPSHRDFHESFSVD